jgi:outer membrane receptor protein involved in Fe transport
MDTCGLSRKLACVIGMGVVASWARAQTAPGGGAAVASDTLAEVVVTAERRTQDIQKAPISVTVLNGEELQQQGRYSVQRILQDVPGVTTYAPRVGGSVQVPGVIPSDNPAVDIVIRGVPADPQPVIGTATASTAYYVDGIYSGVGGDFDINRVELLRGPQGTLYGRSATSGVVSVYTRDPDPSKFSADAMAEFGSYQLHHEQGAVNIPFGNTLALRIAVNQLEENGEVTPQGTAQKEQAVRAKLLYQPSDALKIVLGYTARADYDNSGGSTQQTVANQPDQFSVTTGLIIFPNVTHQRQLWAQVDWNVGIGTLTYLPAYHTYDTKGSVSAFVGHIQQNQVIPRDISVSHELRLTSADSSPVKWVVGGTFYNNPQEIYFNPVWLVSRALVSSRLTDQETRDLGAFAEATIPIAPTWRVTGGLRYDKTKVAVTQTLLQNTSNGNTAPNFDSPLNGYPVNTISGSLSGEAGIVRFSNVTYKLRLEKDLAPQNLLYGMVSTGFLPGSISLSAAGTQIVVLPLNQEKLTSYEVGSKNRFLNDRLQVNGDIFYYSYEGYQQTAQINPLIPNNFVTLSSPARMKGGELEVAYLPTPHDRFNLAYGHTSASFVDVPNTALNPFQTFVAQTKIPGVVPDSLALSYKHTFLLPGGSTLDAYDQLRYTSGYDQSALNAIEVAAGAVPYIHVGNQVIDDFNLDWNSPESRYGATFYVHNVGDKAYKQNANLVSIGFNPPYQAGLTTTQPRFYGVILRARI